MRAGSWTVTAESPSLHIGYTSGLKRDQADLRVVELPEGGLQACQRAARQALDFLKCSVAGESLLGLDRYVLRECLTTGFGHVPQERTLSRSLSDDVHLGG